MARTARVAGIVAFAALTSFDGDKPLAPTAVGPLTNAAKELAKAGRSAELDEVLDLLHRCGMEPSARDKLAVACRKDAAKQKKPAASVPSAAKSLQKLAADLAVAMAQLPVDDQPEFARMVLSLDDHVEAAQKVLGRTKVAGAGGVGEEWLDEANRQRREQRTAIAKAVAQARKLELPVESGKVDHPYFAAAPGKEAHFARCSGVLVNGVWPVEKLERVVREVVRALAVDNFLLVGQLEPPHHELQRFYVLDTRAEYLAAVEIARQKGWVDAAHAADAPKLHGLYVKDDEVLYEVMEGALESTLHSHVLDTSVWKGRTEEFSIQETQTSVRSGLTNWTSLAFLGTRMPVYALEETKEKAAKHSGWTAGFGEEEKREFERFLRLADAGIAGGRAWLQYLALHRRDPPYAATLVDQSGRLQGEELLKATFAFEMLAEQGPTLALLQRMPDKKQGVTSEQIVAAALGKSLPEFDAAWREWFVPPRPGLAQRLGGASAATSLAADEQRTLEQLNALRQRAGLVKEPPVDFDRATSDGCRRHALYLAQNPDQLAHWPDAHEEYPDHKGFDPLGAFAGASSVIAPGVANGRDALDGWMATFYHRLPLLEPGLVRIGFALENKCAVLDCGSFVVPSVLYELDTLKEFGTTPEWWGVLWPPNDATDVPTHFQRELPQPVPGEDESKMGYPITFQLRGHFDSPPKIELVLHAGAATGKVVPCRCSTPREPTNPLLAPEGAWCLIPREPLQSGANYTVTATLEVSVERTVNGKFSSSFRCGK